MTVLTRLCLALALYVVALLYWLLPYILHRTHDGVSGAIVFAVMASIIMPGKDSIDSLVDTLKNDPRINE